MTTPGNSFSRDHLRPVLSFLLPLTSVLLIDVEGTPLAQARCIYYSRPLSEEVLNAFSHHLSFVPDFAFNTPILVLSAVATVPSYTARFQHFTRTISLNPHDHHTKWEFLFLYIGDEKN